MVMFMFMILSSGWIPAYKMPGRSALTQRLLTNEYTGLMDEVRRRLAGSEALVYLSDGVSNVKRNTVHNNLICCPEPFFIEYSHFNLSRETAVNVAKKIMDFRYRSTLWLHPRIKEDEQWFHLILKGDRKIQRPPDGSDQVSAFVRMTLYCSDSCNQMIAVRRTLLGTYYNFVPCHSRYYVILMICSVVYILRTDFFDAVYGDPSHCGNNLCLDILLLPGPKEILRQAMFVVKTIRNVNLIRRLFERSCSRMLGFVLTLVLYSKTRWSSSNRMFLKLTLCRSVISAMPTSLIMNDASASNVELPSGLVDIVSRPLLWNGAKATHFVLDAVCQCIGVLESQQEPMSNVYACFIYIRLHLKNLPAPVKSSLQISEDVLTNLFTTSIYNRFKRIYSPIFALAFICDPFFDEMRASLAKNWSSDDFDPFNLGKGSLAEQAEQAIATLTRGRSIASRDVLIMELAAYMSELESLMGRRRDENQVDTFSLKINFHPKVIWVFAKGSKKYANLAQLLVQLYSCPCGAVACEENHKTMKKIHTEARNRLLEGVVEKQTAVAYNAAVLSRDSPYVRHPFIVHVAALDLPEFVDEATGESQSMPSVVHYNRDVELDAAGVLDEENDKDDELEEVVMESGFVSSGAYDSFNDGF